MSYVTAVRVALLAALAAGCRYDGAPPDGVVVCRETAGCPSGYRCQARPGGDPGITYCCRTDSCGAEPDLDDAAVPVDTAPPQRDVATADLAPMIDVADDGSADAPADATTALEVGAPDVPAGPDFAPEAGPDGSPDAGGCLASGRGPAMVRAGNFCIDATEVTNAQYLAFLQAKVDVSGQGAACKAWNTSFIPGGTDAVWPFLPGTENHPVGSVDWCDAFAFCQWAGKRLCGNIGGGRLASVNAGSTLASQWVSACSADGRFGYAYGQGYDKHVCNTDAPDDHAARLEDVRNRANCVGGYPGLYDMSGNVEEWIDACDKDSGAGDACGVAGNSAYIDVLKPSDLTCTGSVFGIARNRRYVLLGFRCCAD